jgi:epoxide hydrolase-like predicted phosphatase
MILSMSPRAGPAVVLDIGGVLETTPSLGTAEKWEATFGLLPGQMAERAREVWTAGAVGSISEADVHRRLSDVLGVDHAQVDAFMAEMWEEYLGTPNVELIAWFRELRPRYRTGIISNSFVGAREREQERYGFADLTDTVVYSHEVGVSKPDPRIYRLASERLAVAPERMIFLDDVEENVDGARALGIRAVQFTDTRQAIDEIESLLSAKAAG